jgi:F0F1-type ATP synthase alpha subunit
LARYEEVKSFETINTEVTPETLRDIKRGKRIREIFSQDTDLTLSITEQVLILGLAVSPRLDHFEIEEIELFKKHFITFIRQIMSGSLETKIAAAKSLEDIDPLLNKLFTTFTNKYALPPIPDTPGAVLGG